jgi:serine/threonine-protein kinase
MDARIANRYQLLQIIGQGGMGTVWQAKDELLQRMVAIKGIKDRMSEVDSEDTKPGLLGQDMMNEARMMARLQHPSILPIYDLIQEGQDIYIVMPLIMQNLSIFENGAHVRPLTEIIRLLERIADGLDFLHSHEIIHGDLKPDNIFIDEDNQPYIADFGLAIDAHITDLEMDIIGTPGYIAPEGLSGNQLTIKSDLYSFGIIVFVVLTGKHPYASLDFRELIKFVLSASSLPSIGVFRPELSQATIRDIDSVIAKLTEKNPYDRFASAKEATEALYRIVYSSQQIIEGKLFISYAHKDQELVYHLADELQRYNVDFWVDRNIEYGSAWDQSIDNELADSDVMLLVVTPASMQSAYVTYEWSYFLGAGKPVYPFVPHTVGNNVELHSRLQRMQYIKGSDNMAQDVLKIIEVLNKAMKGRKDKSV